MKSVNTGFIWALAASFSVALGFLVFRLLIQPPPPPTAEPATVFAPTPEPDPVEPAPEQSLQDEDPGPRYVLVGTVVASDRRWSRASIAVASEKAALYRMGDQLPGGARLISIGSDRAVLEQFGTRIVLRIKERDPDSRPRVVRPSADPQPETEPGPPPDPEPDDLPLEPGVDQALATRTDGIEQVRPGIFRLDRSTVRNRLAEPGALFADSRVSLAFDEGGTIQGMRLGLDHSDSIFSKIGLQDGDVLRRVGPLVIDSPDSLGKLADLLEQSTELEVELLREGQRIRLRYWLDDR